MWIEGDFCLYCFEPFIIYCFSLEFSQYEDVKGRCEREGNDFYNFAGSKKGN